MKAKSISLKIAKDMFIEQLKWVGWYAVIITIIHILFSVLVKEIDSNIGDLLSFSYVSTPITLLIMAIVAGYTFMTFFLRNGITRRDYYFGAVLGALALSVALILLFGLVSVIEGAAFLAAGIKVTVDPILSNFNIASFAMIISYVLKVFLFYLVGWFIFLGYYRYGWKIGIGFVLLSLGALMFNSILWNDGQIEESIHTMEMGVFFAEYIPSLLGTIAVALLLLGLIRLVTKNIPVKI